MVNGNYILYGDRPCSESEIVEDHVHTHTAERKVKRKPNRTANELQHSLNLAQLDNETDSVKYEKKIKEPRLLRYVPTTDVEENFVTEKFETYDLKPTVERPRRYAFTKKPKNPADGSVNYAHSRSSSSCSSPNGNLPTISEHGEQYGTYRVQNIPSPAVNDLMSGYESKLDKYFMKPREVKKFPTKGSHPDSLYRVPTSAGAGAGKMARVLRVMRWPVALLATCVALAVFVYFLMPNNLESELDIVNSTYWETGVTSESAPLLKLRKIPEQKPLPIAKESEAPTTQKQGTKTPEIDFYDADNDTHFDLISIINKISENSTNRKLPIPPVFPSHITPEVQYGNEKAPDKLRIPKILEQTNAVTSDSTIKPHITQKPEKPLAIYFKDATTTETITRAETVNDFITYDEKRTTKKVEEPYSRPYQTVYKPQSAEQEYVAVKQIYDTEPEIPPEVQEFYSREPVHYDRNFTSGHSKLFGISIEDAEKIKATTQSSLYNTRVSPTLPTWRDGDDSTTKRYPVIPDVPQCHSPHLALCRGVLPYDLAGAAVKIGDVDLNKLLPQIEYLVAANCSDRVKQFACALMEPECNPPPFPPKMPCFNLCQSIVDNCQGSLPRELLPVFNCRQYFNTKCLGARAPCHSREMECEDGSCILRDWICDGTRDCPGGDDERTCVQCHKHEFHCRSGSCIPKQWLCDGYSDCANGEDESESTCSNYQHPAKEELPGEPGEESAGSAPAPSVRRPNRLPSSRHRSEAQSAGDNDSSKELLITSDSGNALKRNFTRRPSPSRLMPYRPKLRQPVLNTKTDDDRSDEKTPKPSPMRNFSVDPSTLRRMTSTIKPIVHNQETTNEGEDVNIGDLDFFDDSDKEHKIEEDKNRMDTEPPVPSPARNTHLDKTINKFEKVVDGASFLRKAAAKEAEENRRVKNETLYEKLEDDEFPRAVDSGGIARASPCPSGELRCVDGRCITLAQLCDGTIDCSDHADEDNCYT